MSLIRLYLYHGSQALLPNVKHLQAQKFDYYLTYVLYFKLVINDPHVTCMVC